MTEEVQDFIIDAPIENVIPKKFLEYAGYVIKDRALPDARDGLKPVQRRLLYAAHELGLTHRAQYKKVARIVGDAMGKYHPHGDASLAEALVNMAQDFSMRYPLIDGHGNFGSIDGDGAAAMRYIEARMSRYGEEMIGAIKKDTVNFKPNFDESEVEPEVLATMFPSLLANGISGIAVGMASSIPPHHVGSIYDAVLFMINRLKAGEQYTIDELIDIVKMPDFPTGGTIINHEEVIRGYKTGRGRVLLRSVYQIEEVKNKHRIIITEIPYQVNKSKLIEKINELRLSDKVEGIASVLDNSKNDVRIIIETKNGANPERILNSLFKLTDLQSSVSMNHVAIFDGHPKQFTLQEALEAFLGHVSTVLANENNYDLNKAINRLPNIEAICAAIDNADDVIEMIRSSKTNAEAVVKLKEAYGFTDEQADTVVNIKIGKLSEENTQKYVQEYQSLTEEVKQRTLVRDDSAVFLNYVEATLSQKKEQFQDERRTGYEEMSGRISDRELVPSKDLIVSITQRGLIKAVETSEYKSANRGSKGQDAKLKDDDAIQFMFTVNSRDDLLIFTDAGRCHLVEAYKLPIVKKTQQGKYLSNYIDLEDEQIVDIVPKKVGEEKDILLITKGGIIKRLEMSTLSTRFKATRVITFKEGDTLNDAVLMPTDGNARIMVFTASGKALHTDPNLIRAQGRNAAGVKLIKLMEHDYIVKSVITGDERDIILATANGFGKRIAPKDFNVKGRGGQGVRAININEKTGLLVAAEPIGDEELFIATKEGMLNRIKTDNIRVMGAQAAGVKIINLNEQDEITHIIPSQEEEDLIDEEVE